MLARELGWFDGAAFRLSVLLVNLTPVMCRLELSTASRAEAVKVAWCQEEPSRKKGGGAKRGLLLPPVPWCRPASHGHCRFPFQPAVVVCPGRSPLKKNQTVLSVSSGHNDVLMAAVGGMVVAGAARRLLLSEAWQCLFSGMTAPNFGPSDLFLPVRSFRGVHAKPRTESVALGFQSR